MSFIKDAEITINASKSYSLTKSIAESRFMSINQLHINELIEGVFAVFDCSLAGAVEIVKSKLEDMSELEFKNFIYERAERKDKNIKLDMDIKYWYDNNYPSDRDNSISKNANFLLLMACLDNGISLDTIGIDDSVIRERVFIKLSEILGCEYEFIYNKWIDNKDIGLKKAFNLISINK